MKQLLIVDDDDDILTLLQMSLERDDFEIDACSDPISALNHLEKKQYHLLISDYLMDDVNGVHLLDFARQIQPHCVRILLTGSNDVDMFKKAINNSQIYKFISKPFEVEEVIQLVEQSIEYQEGL